jgi:hypothetical protein
MKMTWRRYFQFSLRSFLIFVAVFSIGLGWLETNARKQHYSIERIQQLGGRVRFDYERNSPDDPDDGWSPIDQVPWPAWLGESRGRYLFATVEAIYLNDCDLGDEALSHASTFPDLLVLSVDSSMVTDSGVKSIRSLQNLDGLFIVHCKLTDSAIDDIACLRSLRTLGVFGNDITREGEAALRKALPDCKIYPVHR